MFSKMSRRQCRINKNAKTVTTVIARTTIRTTAHVGSDDDTTGGAAGFTKFFITKYPEVYGDVAPVVVLTNPSFSQFDVPVLFPPHSSFEDEKIKVSS